jgi:hypothetical protein
VNGGAFSLTKWYFDGTCADGRAFIAYWASVAWRSLAFTWQDLWVFGADGAAAHRSSLAAGPPPQPAGGAFSWKSAALDASIRVEPTVPSISERLLESELGVIDWRVPAPAALVTADFAGSPPMAARGYAECISMTIPPWRLPIRELRWGRWMDTQAECSVVWIDWRGELARQWLYMDGRRLEVGDLRVSDNEVCAGDVQLSLRPRRTLHDRSLAQVVDHIPLARAALPESVLALRQTKGISSAEFIEAGQSTRSGDAIHETVVFR